MHFLHKEVQHVTRVSLLLDISVNQNKTHAVCSVGVVVLIVKHQHCLFTLLLIHFSDHERHCYLEKKKSQISLDLSIIGITKVNKENTKKDVKNKCVRKKDQVVILAI